jgi:hypothetical protein
MYSGTTIRRSPWKRRTADGRRRDRQDGSIPVVAARYVRFMTDRIIFIAGEPLPTLDEALDQLKICDLPCGCLGLEGTLTELLSQCLARALKTIDAELTEWADDQKVDCQGVDSVRELLHRLGRREMTDG